MDRLILFLTSILILTGCMSSEFILTGPKHESLPLDYPVKVVLPESGQRFEYEDIGILRVKQSDMDNLLKAVELAKKEARLRGGDIVILSSSDSKTSVSGNAYGVFSSENNLFMFIIGKLKQ